MPTYEYVCDACGYEFEKFHSITAPAIRKCPECSRLKVRRLIGTGAGIIFKGSGFYQTDYRNGDYKAAASKDTAASSGESSSSTAASSDSKAATPKTETKTEAKPASSSAAD